MYIHVSLIRCLPASQAHRVRRPLGEKESLRIDTRILSWSPRVVMRNRSRSHATIVFLSISALFHIAFAYARAQWDNTNQYIRVFLKEQACVPARIAL